MGRKEQLTERKEYNRKTMLGKRILKRPFFYDWANDDDTVYFSMRYYNALCRANLRNDQVEIMATFPGISNDKGNEYFGIYKYKNYLLLGPSRSTDDFLIYDISNSQFQRLPNEGENSFYSIRVFENSNCLYTVSTKTAEVNRIDLQDFSVKRMVCDELFIDDAQVMNVAKVDNLIYIPVNQKKKMLIFNTKQEEFQYCDFPCNISLIATIYFYNDKFWITGETEKIYAWDINKTEAQEVINIPDDVELYYERNIWFGYSYIYNESLWLFPAFANTILKYDILTKKLDKFELAGEEESIEKIEEELTNGRPFAIKYGIVKRYKNRLFFLSSKTRIFYELDLFANNVYGHDLQMINVYNNQIYPPLANGIMSEANYDLQSLIRIMKYTTNVEIRGNGIMGKTIYSNINKQN